MVVKNPLEIKLKNKVAIVVGSNFIFGKEICLALALSGAEVWIHHFNEEDKIEQISKEISSLGGTAKVISGDLRKLEEVQKVISKIAKNSGKIDILINNIHVLSKETIEDLDPNDWIETLEFNLDIPFLCSKEVIPHMLRIGEGNIINISATAAVTGEIGPHYAASKSALNSMTKGLSREFREFGIRVNSISPDIVQTSTSLSSLSKAVANTVLFLCSPYATHLKGEIIFLGEEENIH
ncbi:MAG: SDR family NAD(P)-dependent oxidoreductase [Bacillaceae bacterium]|jgi:3-oxoacyl-[acyl-carrier protein] reductase|nr:hypothetical protein A3Q35_05395 [Aeribacillus pallidus]REJ18364.1 MAG: SDR family NAD(P)-dependent oxidoreductase [Bacillaceae bacterium]REJ26535.1 MAG: SDR family NAD(P)-dependent oxidoreductase [Bacillaceae bacterium]RZI51149.1 SDR family oxidoreductase [Aeribacillus pallidus]